MSYSKTCQYCKSWYQSKRSNSRFCSTSCRVQYSKIDSTQKLKAAKANMYIQELMDSLKRFPETADNVDEQLEWLQGKIALARLTLPQLQKRK